MTLTEIRVPDFVMPKKDLLNPCPCQDRPIETVFKRGLVFWVKQVGERVEEAEVLCELEIEKKTAELPASAPGILREQTIPDGGDFDADSILGYMECLR